MIKTKRTTSVHCIIAGFRIIIITIAPEPGLCCTVTDICVCVCVIQPERNVDPADLIDMVLVLKDLRQELLSLQMLHKSGLGRLLVQLKRDQDIRAQVTGKLSGHDDRISAEWAGGGCRIFICHNLASAGFTVVSVQSLLLAFFPGTALCLFPLHVIGLFFFQGRVVLLQCFNLKFCVAVRTFQLLCLAVKTDSTSAAGTLVFL